MDPSVPHPGMVFFSGAWRTPAAVEQKRTHSRAWSRKRYATNEEYRAYKAQYDARYFQTHRYTKYIQINNRLNARDAERLKEVLSGNAQAQA